MSHENNSEQIDENLYSRQLYVLGHDAMLRMRKEKVLITSCKGVGVEIAKNIALAGLKEVTMMDTSRIEPKDFSSNFFLKQGEHKGKDRVLPITVAELSELNPNCQINSENEDFESLLLKKKSKLASILDSRKITILVLVNASLKVMLETNLLCRSKNIKLVCVNSHGLFCSIINDFGDAHSVLKRNDGETASGIITHLQLGTSEHSALSITVLDEENSLYLTKGSKVILKGFRPNWASLLWDKEKQQERRFEIVKVLGNENFHISLKEISQETIDTLLKGSETQEQEMIPVSGQFQVIEEPFDISMDPLVDLFSDFQNSPEKFTVPDFEKLDRLPFYLEALRKMEKGKYPEKPYKQKYLTKALGMFESNEVRKEEIQELIRVWGTSLAPVNSVIGGIASQEVVKAASSKFTPINQALLMDFSEVAGKGVFSEESENAKFKPSGDRYDDIKTVFGEEVLNSIKSSKGLMIGAGAIGCELLKNFAMTGFFLSAQNSKEPKSPNAATKYNLNKEEVGLIVIDDDTIEKSNLNRQFLFREKNVGSPKAFAAAKSTLSMNPQIDILPEHLLFDSKYKNISKTVDSRTLLFAALDNQDARLFLDNQALSFRKPMFDSGTLGLRGSTQAVLPGMTENYGATRDPVEKAIPACTLKHYPYKPEHVIHWARDLFDGEYRLNPELTQSYIDKKGKGFSVKESEERAARLFFDSNVKNFEASENNKNFSDCSLEEKYAVLARGTADLFVSLYRDPIAQLLHNYPPNALNSSGNLFWSGTKRCPTAIEFDLDNPDVIQFMESTLFLKCSLLNLPVPNFTPNSIKNFLGDYKPAETKINKLAVIPESEEQSKQNKAPEEFEKLSEPQKEIVAGLGSSISPLEFEKDCNQNGHIRFIAICAKLRAHNYSIGGDYSSHNVKKIAGNIIPAMATTTAMVAGLVVIEALKFIQRLPIEKYRSSSSNLSEPYFGFFEPMGPEKKKIKANDEILKLLRRDGSEVKDGMLEISLWDRMELPLSNKESGSAVKVEDLFSIMDKCGLVLTMVTYGKFCLVSFFMPEEKLEERMKMTILEVLLEEEILKEIPDSNEVLFFDIFATDKDENDVDLPVLGLKF